MITKECIELKNKCKLPSYFSQVSVIRGKVVAADNTALIGVRVDIDKQPLYGYTRTRAHGM